MTATFAPGDIIHIEHAVRPGHVIHDRSWPVRDTEATQVWQNGRAVAPYELRRIETSADTITLTTDSQRVTARPSGESQPGMVVGEVTATAPALPPTT